MSRAGEDHGSLLFEDDCNYRVQKKKWLLGSISLLIFGVFIIILFSMGLVTEPRQNSNSDAAWGIIIGMLALISAVIIIELNQADLIFNKFRIYENGIQFTQRSFAYFSEIEHIERYPPDGEYIRIYTNDRRPFPICWSVVSGPAGRHTPEGVGDWDGFLRVLETQLKRWYPNVNENWLIRDFTNVGWSYEARMLFESRKGPEPIITIGGSLERRIIEAVLISGRNQVEVADVMRFLN